MAASTNFKGKTIEEIEKIIHGDDLQIEEYDEPFYLETDQKLLYQPNFTMPFFIFVQRVEAPKDIVEGKELFRILQLIDTEQPAQYTMPTTMDTAHQNPKLHKTGAYVH